MVCDLVGCTGFVGSNLAKSNVFDGMYHSTNIMKAYGRKPDILVYAGIRAEMFTANKDPKADFLMIRQAICNIRKINPKCLILISTISVYGENVVGDEKSVIDETRLSPYGKNRLYLEKWVESSFNDHLVIRLPALYGDHLRKNFIYDYIHKIPILLKEEKYNSLLKDNSDLKRYYEKQENGYYKCRNLESQEKRDLMAYFAYIGFSAVDFTDSRSQYQFYNLKYLWEHIKMARDRQIRKINLVTEPVEISELYTYLSKKEFDNKIMDIPYTYNLRSVYAHFLGGSGGYLWDKEFVKRDIKNFTEEVGKKEGII